MHVLSCACEPPAAEPQKSPFRITGAMYSSTAALGRQPKSTSKAHHSNKQAIAFIISPEVSTILLGELGRQAACALAPDPFIQLRNYYYDSRPSLPRLACRVVPSLRGAASSRLTHSFIHSLDTHHRPHRPTGEHAARDALEPSHAPPLLSCNRTPCHRCITNPEPKNCIKSRRNSIESTSHDEVLVVHPAPSHARAYMPASDLRSLPCCSMSRGPRPSWVVRAHLVRLMHIHVTVTVTFSRIFSRSAHEPQAQVRATRRTNGAVMSIMIVL